ncbi:MAG: hypothetical protein RLZZ76_421 [Candidatus Parcubacteria bacterium]|jgi:hypothetical protein
MDPVSPAQKNITRIRTFKDDVLRAQGNTLSNKAVSTEVAKKNTLVVPTVEIVASPLTQKNYTPLPSPSQTVAAIPKADTATHLVDPVAVLRKNPIPPKASYKPSPAHTISVSESDIAQIAHIQKASILTDEGTLHNEHTLGEGTIVRDTKRKRFKLFPAIVSSLSSWFSDTKAEYKKAVHGPVHTVAKAESRLETIRKAIEQGRQAPKDDFVHVSANLKAIPREQVQSAVIIKEKSELPAATWSHIVDESDVAQVVPEARAPKVLTPVRAPIAESMEVEEIVPTPVASVQPEVYVPSAPQPQIAEVEVPQNLPTRSVQYAPAREPSERPFYVALASIVFIATLLGVGVSYYFFGKTNTDVVIKDEVAYEAPKLFTANTTFDFPLPADRLTLLSILQSSTEENSEAVIHLYPTVGEEVVPADMETVLSVLNPRAPGGFIRGVREIAFGGAYGEPFMVLTTSSFDAAFSGMLSWEEAMSADLSPLFGSPVFESFNPEVRTNTGTSAAFFKDIIASNKNARLLVDENGDDRIVYTFVDQNTIVITTTREALGDIIQLLK